MKTRLGVLCMVIVLLALAGGVWEQSGWGGQSPWLRTAIAAPADYDCAGQSELPAAECGALVTLYSGTNGAAWHDKSGWLATTTPCSWYGVLCADGHVLSLGLQENGLNGSIPADLGHLTNVQSLYLQTNGLTGSIPPELGELANLQTLYLHNNGLTGGIPPELGNLTAMQELALSNNPLGGGIPPELGNLTQLKALSLYANGLSGTIPPTLGAATALELLYLHDNALSGSIPPALGNLTALNSLYLYNNQLSGSIPSTLGNLAVLQNLYLYTNELSGALPAELGNLSALDILNLAGNNLDGSIPPELGHLANLHQLSLNDNQLSGGIPSDLGNLTQLQILDLANNQLSGALPAELGNLTSLQNLHLQNNQLSGAIPPSLSNLHVLQQLYLHTNHLSGNIPPELGNLGALTVLYLSDNQLTGVLPPALGNLGNVRSLYLNDNGLGGSVPPELGNLANLQHLNLARTGLSGALPPELTHIPQMLALVFNDTGLCVPTDFAFQAWLATISQVIGTNQPCVEPTPTSTPTMTPTPPAPGVDDPAPTPVPPAQVPNGIAATIHLNPSQGYGGQTVTVSGALPDGYSLVRIAIVADGQTLNSALVAGQNGAYNYPLLLPSSLAPQTLRICAILAGATNAEMRCADFQVVAAPTGEVAGVVQGVLGNASMVLLNARGSLVATAPIPANGRFKISNVPPGSYRFAPIGQLQQPLSGGVVNVQSGLLTELTTRATNCALGGQLVEAGVVRADPSRIGLLQQMLRDPFGNPVNTLNVNGPIGIYVEGVRDANINFVAFPQTSKAPGQVRFRFLRPDGTIFEEVNDPDGVAPWQITYDVGKLPASQNGRNPKVIALPVVDGVLQCAAAMQDIEVIPNFLKIDGVQDKPIKWDATRKLYVIRAIIPDIPGVLPGPTVTLPPRTVGPLPYFGYFDNRADAGIALNGTLTLDGKLEMRMMSVFAYVQLLNKVVLGEKDLPLFDMKLKADASNPTVGILNSIREYQIPYPPAVNEFLEKFNTYIPTPFVSVPVASFFGLIDLTVHGSAGFGFSFTLTGYIKPLKPETSSTFTPKARANAELGMGLRVAQGLANFGATARLDGSVETPLTLVLSTNPDAGLRACLGYSFKVRAFGEVIYGLLPGTKYDETQELSAWNDCLQVFAAGQNAVPAVWRTGAVTETLPTIPNLIAAPQIAAAPDGQMLRAWTANTAAAGAAPVIQVLASLKTPGAQSWGAALPLSDPLHSARNVVVGFVGPDVLPVAAWVENTFTPEQAAAAGDDFAAHLNRQEIVYSIYHNGAWSAPVYLTSDNLGDGLPALGAGTGGAVLAWVRDTDGNPATRADQQIAAARFDLESNSFGLFVLLAARPTGFNADVAAAWAPAPSDQPWLAWIADGDADLVTADDRRMAVATFDGADWQVSLPDYLPARTDSPAIVATAGSVRLAFLVREATTDGQVPLLGANGMLWTAYYSGGLWTAKPVIVAGGPVYGEQPDLATNGSETLLLFRRFGAGDDYSALGQLALSQMMEAGQPSAPLYLTDEPRQNWYGALAINPLDGTAQVMKVARALPDGQAEAAGLRAIAGQADGEVVLAAKMEAAARSATDDPVDIAVVDDAPNLALDPLVAAERSPDAGSVLSVTVSVRNAGRNPASGATVRLFTASADGAPAATLVVTPGLGFNESQAFQAAVIVPASAFTLSAVLIPAGADANSPDDRRTLVFGELAAPVMVGAQESGSYRAALSVTWLSVGDDQPDGFRVYRGATANGPWDLIGETTGPSFDDLEVVRGQTYCYRAESFHASGGLSQVAPEPVCGSLALLSLYLPVVARE